MNAGFPSSDMELTYILVVNEMEPSRSFYRDVLGATVVREYGGTSCVLNFQGSWLLLVTGGGPTQDKPDVTFASPQDFRTVSHAMTIRVPDCKTAYETLKLNGTDLEGRSLTVNVAKPPRSGGGGGRGGYGGDRW